MSQGALLAFLAAVLYPQEEFKVKREEVFEFARKPQVVRKGDRVEITFETRGRCDVTVAVEDGQGHIVRHLASGVLGPKAPAPFRKDSLAQTVVWDGKNDQGEYIDDKDSHTVRVSLGLKPAFEKNLYWDPRKRISQGAPQIHAAEEGVYVFESHGVDHLRLFDHDGNYVRTIYPFPADKLEQVQGLEWHTFPQDGRKLPLKQGFVQATLLTSGTSALFEAAYKFGDGIGATGMAAKNGRIALAYEYLNRLASDGSTGGLPLKGPKTGHYAKWDTYGGQGGGKEVIGPTSLAFSPDGKWVYMTGHVWTMTYGGGNCLHGVLKVPYEGGGEAQLFAGRMSEGGHGTDNAHFRVPTSVSCDRQGRVYVSDFMNDRVQVFRPDGTLLTSLPVNKPAQVAVHQRNDEIYVFSWPVIGISNSILKETEFHAKDLKPTLTVLGPLENPKPPRVTPLPTRGSGHVGLFARGELFEGELDSWTDPPTLWIVGSKRGVTRVDVQYWGSGVMEKSNMDPWMDSGILLLVEKDGKWVAKKDFAQDARQTVARVAPPAFSRQRLYVNPRNRKLYVGEDLGFGKSFKELVEIDPETGKCGPVALPFDAEDIAFDTYGLAYLRTDTLVARYNAETWREVPWDYGEERDKVTFKGHSDGKAAPVVSGLGIPGSRPVCWNQGGMYVSPKGHLVVSCCSFNPPPKRARGEEGAWERMKNSGGGKPYTPRIFPGRVRWQEVHIWDRHGKLLYEDAVPGLHILKGIAIDQEDNIYVEAGATRICDGKPYFNTLSNTLMKFPPKGGKVVSSSGGEVRLGEGDRPARDPDILGGPLGRAWVEGAEWFYGGIGYGGFNSGAARIGGGCACWNSRFALDFFGRSFAPEVDHYSVAALDPSGNLILRIGKYGNADSSGPAGRVPLGGDEVGLFHACFLASHTDRRLFIADAGNARVVSVRLDYHVSERVALRNVKDEK